MGKERKSGHMKGGGRTTGIRSRPFSGKRLKEEVLIISTFCSKENLEGGGDKGASREKIQG